MSIGNTLVVHPIILHIPHASTRIPKEVENQFLLNSEQLKDELDLMTDHATDRVFTEAFPKATAIVFPVSRLVVDPERFSNDAQEEMASVGMGVVYTHGSQGQPIRRILNEVERQYLIRQFYDPHHKKLEAAVELALQQHGKCLVLDCHSYPSEILPYELHRTARRPQICLGTDKYHTPEKLISRVEMRLLEMGIETARNEPFAGTLVPQAYYRRDRRVYSLMLEINRALYLNERFCVQPRSLRRLVEVLHALHATLIDCIYGDTQ